MKKLNIIGILLLIFITSCRKDINEVNENITTEPPIVITYNQVVENIVGSVIGQVVDENNQPVVYAAVTMNGENLSTDAYGHFFVNEKTMNSRGTLVEVKRQGYFDGSRRFFPIEGATNRIKIQLIKKDFNNEFNASEGGEILIEGGAKVEFEPNSIRTANGDIYEGNVFVASKWMDPTSLETLDQMPGNLQGVNRESEEVTLETYGMVAVELQAPNGATLNIAEGKTAIISMPVPDELLLNAPEEIPLWSYNEDYGLWVEESSATLQNGIYVGKVSHFSFWNCDYFFDVIELDMTFLDNNNVAVSDLLVLIQLNSGFTGHGYTDNNGSVSGLVPANQELTISLIDHCGVTLFSQTYGPYNSDTSLGNIVVDVEVLNNTVIQGNLVDCQGDPVNNGVVITILDGISTYHYVTGGTFDITLTPCLSTTNIQVIGADLDNEEQSLSQTAFVNTINDLGTIQVCGTALENYLKVTVDGYTIYYLGASAFIDTNQTITAISATGGGGEAQVFFYGDTVGDYSASNYIEYMIANDGSVSWSLNAIPLGDPAFSSFIVTQFDTKVIGNFSGTLDNNGITVTVTGEFSVNL